MLVKTSAKEKVSTTFETSTVQLTESEERERLYAKLCKYVPSTSIKYTNSDRLNKLIAFQKSLHDQIKYYENGEPFTTKETLSHVQKLATENNLRDDETYLRLCSGMNNLSRIVAGLRNGENGEKEVAQILDYFKTDSENRVLYNIGIAHENDITELDSIVITTYGVFVIEVKNFKPNMFLTRNGIFETADSHKEFYNLAVKMQRKEKLIRMKLSEFGKLPIHMIVLYSNDRSKLISDYEAISISRKGTIVPDIEKYSSGKNRISPETIQQIAEKLTTENVETKMTCRIDCEPIAKDFSYFMARVEAINEKLPSITVKEEKESIPEKPKVEWKAVVSRAVPLIASAITTVMFLASNPIKHISIHVD